MKRTISIVTIACILVQTNLKAQQTDANAPLHALKPD